MRHNYFIGIIFFRNQKKKAEHTHHEENISNVFLREKMSIRKKDPKHIWLFGSLFFIN